MAEGFSEDAPSLPDGGLDAKRYKSFDGTPPANGFIENTFARGSFDASDVNQGEQKDVAVSYGENDFPRQTGHDSLSTEEELLT